MQTQIKRKGNEVAIGKATGEKFSTEKISSLLRRDFDRNKMIYLMLLPVVIYYIIFHYVPMYGATIAFKQYSISKGVLGSPWIGFDHFIRFFNSYQFERVVRNTFLINMYMLIFGFPAPILLAIMLNEVRQEPFKRAVQTVSYLPHFISTVVVAGIIIQLTSMDGLLNNAREYFGLNRIPFMLLPSMFRTIYVSTGIWQEVGWGSIVYLSALTAVSPEIYEAARIDGAGRFGQIMHVTIPGIMPTVVIMLILRIGSMMNVGFEKILLLTNQNTWETGEVISSYVYRASLTHLSNYDYGAAVGLFNSVINLVLLGVANCTSRVVTETSLW